MSVSITRLSLVWRFPGLALRWFLTISLPMGVFVKTLLSKKCHRVSSPGLLHGGNKTYLGWRGGPRDSENPAELCPSRLGFHIPAQGPQWPQAPILSQVLAQLLPGRRGSQGYSLRVLWRSEPWGPRTEDRGEQGGLPGAEFCWAEQQVEEGQSQPCPGEYRRPLSAVGDVSGRRWCQARRLTVARGWSHRGLSRHAWPLSHPQAHGQGWFRRVGRGRGINSHQLRAHHEAGPVWRAFFLCLSSFFPALLPFLFSN